MVAAVTTKHEGNVRKSLESLGIHVSLIRPAYMVEHNTLPLSSIERQSKKKPECNETSISLVKIWKMGVTLNRDLWTGRIPF